MTRHLLADLDGVMWLGNTPIPGAAEAIAAWRSRGIDVVFVTNNSFVRVGDVEAKLQRHGVDASGFVVTSAQAGASLVRPGERVFVAGGPGASQEVRRAGGVLVRTGHIDAVVVGLNRAFDYDLLDRVSRAIRAGARFIATNDDSTYPTPAGLTPGGGALVAAVQVASGVTAVVAGKPHRVMADYVVGRFGKPLAMIGDRGDTDGMFAVQLGVPFALVLSGVTTESDLPVEPSPAFTAADIGGLVDQIR